jgi:hypothetical protein
VCYVPQSVEIFVNCFKAAQNLRNSVALAVSLQFHFVQDCISNYDMESNRIELGIRVLEMQQESHVRRQPL